MRWKLSGSIDKQTDAADYMAITADRMRRLRLKYGWKRWDELALLEAHKWAGHVVRITSRAPHRLVGKVLVYRGSAYLRTLETLYGSQCHPGRFHVWRWEQQFSRIFGIDWFSLARDGERWEESAEQWLSRASKRDSSGSA